MKGVELSVYIASGMASMVPKAPNCRCYKDGDKNTGGDYRTIRLIAMDGSYPDPTAKPWKNFLAKRPESNKSKMSPIAFGNSEPTP